MSDTQFVEPVPPPNFTYVPDEFQRGSYVIGHDQFSLATFPLANLFQRELTGSDDFLLGILSVILIAVLSDLVFTILLRTTANRISPFGLFTAFMVDEATHFRNVLRIARRAKRGPARSAPTPPDIHTLNPVRAEQPDPVSAPRASVPPALLSALVLAVLLALFVADVLIVVVTQPRTLSSAKHAYNLRAVYPAATNIALASYVRRLAIGRPCVAPVMANGSSTQTRRFHLNVCLGFTREVTAAARADAGPDVAPRVRVTSLFHAAGVDHNVSFPAGWLAVSVRVQVMTDGELQGVRYLLFDSADDAAMSHARYLHNLFMTDAKRHSCKRGYDKQWCRERAKRMTAPTEQHVSDRTISSWNGKNSQHKVAARVLDSVFEEDLPRSYRSLLRGARVLITSAVVREMVGPGAYVNTRDDAVEDGIAGLLEENSRVAGVVLLALLTVSAVTAMLTMRVWLKPTTLSELAVHGVDYAREPLSAKSFEDGSDTYPGLASDPPSLDPFQTQTLPAPCSHCGQVQRPTLLQVTRRVPDEQREEEAQGGASFL